MSGAEGNSVSICVGCGFCCDGTLFRSAGLQPGEDLAPLEQAGARFHRRSSGEWGLTLGCGAFADGRCHAYEHRPSACRAYRCRVLHAMEAGEMSEAEARELIAATKDLRDRVQPTLAPLLEPTERRALEDVYRGLLRRFEPSSSLAQPVRRRRDEAAPPEEVFDVLGLRDLAILVAGGTDADFVAEGFADPSRTLGRATHLVVDRAEQFGPRHPDTLVARHAEATWTGLWAKPLDALAIHREVLAARLDTMGPDHPHTLSSRQEVADWTGVCGEPEEALTALQVLLADRTRILGPSHPATLNTRQSIAYWTGVLGRGAEALDLYRDLADDRARLDGPDHPDTLGTRYSVTHWTGAIGDVREALVLGTGLLVDRLRVSGPDHPDTTVVGRAVAHWSRQVAASAAS